jgi:hypothetical protein
MAILLYLTATALKGAETIGLALEKVKELSRWLLGHRRQFCVTRKLSNCIVR